MDHLRIDKFMVMGFCIGGPFIWNLLRRAPNRVVAAVLAQPSGSRPEMRDLFYDNNIKGWGPELVKRRPEIPMEMVDKFLTKMYRTNADFVFTVTRDFVRTCQTPVLILPDDIPAHPYAVAMEAAMLAPKAEVSMFPWKEPKERIPLAVRQIRSFLRAHRPASLLDRRWLHARTTPSCRRTRRARVSDYHERSNTWTPVVRVVVGTRRRYRLHANVFTGSTSYWEADPAGRPPWRCAAQ